MTQQPNWQLLANMGDVNPIDYGGYFVLEDTTGIYPHEVELLVAPTSENQPESEGPWTVYRFSIPQCTLLNRPSGHAMGLDSSILSDNKFHPEIAAWFAEPEIESVTRPQDTTYLSNVAESANMPLDTLREWFCSDDVFQRAHAYRLVGEYHGFDNFDHDPLTFTSREEVEERYDRPQYRKFGR